MLRQRHSSGKSAEENQFILIVYLCNYIYINTFKNWSTSQTKFLKQSDQLMESNVNFLTCARLRMMVGGFSDFLLSFLKLVTNKEEVKEIAALER